MESPDIIENEKIYDMELIIQGLFTIYPDAKYIAFNAAISNKNQHAWTDHWYISVMRYEPTLEVIDGYYTWVSRNPNVNLSVNPNSSASEDAIAFIHFSSKGYFFKNLMLQTSRDEFISPDKLCWMRTDQNEIVHFVKERNDAPPSNEIIDYFSDYLQERGLKMNF